MRKEFWEWFCENANKYNLYFIFNDLWRFEVPGDIQHRVLDLGTSEDLMWPVAAGIARNQGRVFTYGVSFFIIGRLESLRSEIIHNDLEVYILNAGAHGYDQYGPSHSFYNQDDLKVMQALDIETIDPETSDASYTPRMSWDLFATGNQISNIIYLRLGSD